MQGEIRHIEINLGRLCNNLCIFCMIREGKGDSKHRIFANAEKVKKEIDKFSKEDYNSLGFLGGEPSIYPSLSEIVSYARDKGFSRITIVSNGRRYSDKGFVKNLIDSGVTRFCVSIHSHLPEVEDRLTGVKGGFSQKIAGIRNLVEFRKANFIKEDIAISLVLNKKNYKGIMSTLSFFNSLGVRDFRVNFIRPEGRALANFEELVPRYSQFAKYLHEIFQFSDKKGIRVSLGDMPLCMVGNIEKNLRFIGELKDHINMVVSFDNTGKKGKPSKETFLWRDRRKNEHKIKGKKCRICRYDVLCEGPWKNYAEKFGFDEFKPIR